jgi:hypothetical protein
VFENSFCSFSFVERTSAHAVAHAHSGSLASLQLIAERDLCHRRLPGEAPEICWFWGKSCKGGKHRRLQFADKVAQPLQIAKPEWGPFPGDRTEFTLWPNDAGLPGLTQMREGAETQELALLASPKLCSRQIGIFILPLSGIASLC